MVRLLANVNSNVNLCGFLYQLQASYVSSHTEELWYNENVRLWMTIYIYVCVCVCVCVYYIVVSVTLSFMLSAFVRVSSLKNVESMKPRLTGTVM